MSSTPLRFLSPGLLLAGALLVLSHTALAVQKLGFNLDHAAIPIADIPAGGPPRDGIPSIDRPKFVPVGKARFMKDDDLVVSFTHNGETRAYPHDCLTDGTEVEDTVGGTMVRLKFDRANRHLMLTGADGAPLPFTPAYWFAWQAFHPNTTVWSTSP